MTYHTDLKHSELFRLIKVGAVVLAGNRQLKIYGSLRCASGKRMKRENRVFFASEPEAVVQGYRPCGHCMKTAYQSWKHESIR